MLINNINLVQKTKNIIIISAAGLLAFIAFFDDELLKSLAISGGNKGQKIYTNKNFLDRIAKVKKGFQETFFKTLLSFCLETDDGVFYGPLRGSEGIKNVNVENKFIDEYEDGDVILGEKAEKAMLGRNINPRDYDMRWLSYLSFSGSWTPLELDGFNYKRRIAFEYNGKYHYKFSIFTKDSSTGNNEIDMKNYLRARKNDFVKQIIAANEGIYFITLSYEFAEKFIKNSGDYGGAASEIKKYLINEKLYKAGFGNEKTQKINYIKKFNEYVEVIDPPVDYELTTLLAALTQIKKSCLQYKNLFDEIYRTDEECLNFLSETAQKKDNELTARDLAYQDFRDVTYGDCALAWDIFNEDNYFYMDQVIKVEDRHTSGEAKSPVFDVITTERESPNSYQITKYIPDPEIFREITREEQEERSSFIKLKYFSRYHSKRKLPVNPFANERSISDEEKCALIAAYINGCLNRVFRRVFLIDRFAK
jgi:hypothetical protein